MAQPVEATIQYRDHAGKESSSTTYVKSGLTIDQMEEGLRGLAQVVDGVVGTIVNGITFSVSVDISALTSNSTVSTADVEDIGSFQFVTSENRPVNINIPGIDTSLAPLGTDNIDLANSSVAAFVSLMEDGVSTPGGTIIPTDINEVDISAVVYARETVRNSGARG